MQSPIAATILAFNPSGYPWGNKLLASGKAGAVLRHSLNRGCAGLENTTWFGIKEYSYTDFGEDVVSRDRFQQLADKHGLDPVLFLLQRQNSFNRHISFCAVAVLKALQLWRLYLLNTVTTLSVGDVTVWEKGFHEMTYIERLLGALTCAGCGERRIASLGGLVFASGWAIANDWVQHLWGETMGRFQQAERDQEYLSDILQETWKSNLTSDADHLRLLRDGQMLLEKLRKAGLLRSWVVARGTMIFAMRYGHTRGMELPSGHVDKPVAPPLDMDAYVLTDSWDALLNEVQNIAQASGFRWCGWQAGWPKNTMFCVRGGSEFEINLVTPEMTSSMLPTTRCLVRPLEPTALDASDGGGGGGGSSSSSSSAAAVGVPAAEGTGVAGLAVTGALELPCPRDPMGFMREVWGKHKHVEDLLACLPLPVTLYGGLKEVSEEDVRFLWERAKELHMAGYLGMAPYYANCRNHQHEALANALGREPLGVPTRPRRLAAKPPPGPAWGLRA